jgi:predicted nucleic acid-binding protein
MTLVDTSVWIDHLRGGDAQLEALLADAQVLVHPFVIGELACGSLRQRGEVLTLLRRLPAAVVATDDEVHHLVESRRLWARGLGWVDLHLLASALLEDVPLLTRDRQLAATAGPVTGN